MREFEGKDLEEVLRAASSSLGIAEPELDYEILEQGRRGLFGLGARNVRIRVMPPVGMPPPPREPRAETVKRPAQPGKAAGTGEKRERGRRSERRGRRGSRSGKSAGPARPARPAKRQQSKPVPEELEPATPEQRPVVETLRKMLDLMGLEISVEGANAAGDLRLTLDGKDEKQLTRRDGELLAAIQFLLTRMSRRAWPEVGRIYVGNDTDSEEVDDDLVELVREVIQQVGRTGRAKRLHPMNAYERRLVHIAVRKVQGLASRSEGSGPTKRVKIYKR
jgi:spoIIIJ-associated protein